MKYISGSFAGSGKAAGGNQVACEGWRFFRAAAAVLGLAFLLLAGGAKAQTQVFLSTSFATNAEGWVVINWDGTGTGVIPTWYSTNGNPGGYVRATDVQPDGFWKAPASYHTNWSTAYGGSLSYDAFSVAGSAWVMNDVFLAGNGQTLTYHFPTNPPTNWTTFTVKLDGSAGWQYGQFYTDTNGVAATDAQIRSVLTNVTDLRIRQEYLWGADDSGLDNVVVTVGNPVISIAAATTNSVWVTLRNLTTNRPYELEQTDGISDKPAWQTAFGFTATNVVEVFSLPRTNLQQFYRAKAL